MNQLRCTNHRQEYGIMFQVAATMWFLVAVLCLALMTIFVLEQLGGVDVSFSFGEPKIGEIRKR